MGTYAGQRRRQPSGCGWIKFALLGVVISIFFQGALCEVEPTESQCRPYIEKALKEQHLEVDEKTIDAVHEDLLNEENPPTDDLTDSTEGSIPRDEEKDDDDDDDGEVGKKDDDDDNDANPEELDGEVENDDDDDGNEVEGDDDKDDDEKEEDDKDGDEIEADQDDDAKDDNDNDDDGNDDDDKAEADAETEDQDKDEEKPDETDDGDDDEKDVEKEGDDDGDDDDDDGVLERPIDVEVHEVELDDDDDDNEDQEDDKDDDKAEADDQSQEVGKDDGDDDDDDKKESPDDEDDDDDDKKDDEKDDDKEEEKEDDDDVAEKQAEADVDDKDDDKDDDDKEDEKEAGKVDDDDDKDDDKDNDKDDDKDEDKDEDKDGEDDKTEDEDKDEVHERIVKRDVRKPGAEGPAESEEAEDKDSKEDKDQESTPEEEELIKEVVIPENLRPREHISKILKLEDTEMETTLHKTIDTTLKSLKGLYDSAIKPLEMLYKYRDLSNRHFGDPEIFSKPLILFMGPWSGGKSSTINYLLDNEFSHTSLRTGAEPSPAYFNILMHGEQEEILDGTQLAADWTFSGLQKFGQSLLDRLRGIKLPNKLLEKVNIVEIPGILEIRKQVQRLFPFNDACQWFIDRADIIFLVYDPSKLDVGPETEAILDQLKGREYQTRIILNKADQVKPEELMRVQGTLIWNISPLMSSSEPPIMYSTSLWSMPYEAGAPTRLLLAQERAFLRDLREAIDKRVENKIASARRFAVRVRNHAKMVDCYLTTYYNHKTIFGNRKKISDDIIEYPQKYHIYEGLSTLTNISRYDLPDPDVYRDFFKINPLYEFKKLSETCTYFRGCPINQLDVAIAYDLPELVGKYKKAVEASKEQAQKGNS